MASRLSETEITKLIEAIRLAESSSTGEIRLHIDSSHDAGLANKAFSLFYELGMDKTRDRNAVLFFVNFTQRYLTIIGDEGIHKKVCQSFWDTMHDMITASFAQGVYYTPLKNALLKTGEELKKYFPSENSSVNELPDEITFS